MRAPKDLRVLTELEGKAVILAVLSYIKGSGYVEIQSV